MSTSESSIALSEAVESYAATHVTLPELLASPERERALKADLWQSSIENKLIEWGKQGTRYDEDGLISPAPSTVSAAFRIAAKLRNAGIEAPLRMVQDGVGGIVFEWKQGATAEKLLLAASGRLEAAYFRDSKLMHRYPLSFS